MSINFNFDNLKLFILYNNLSFFFNINFIDNTNLKKLNSFSSFYFTFISFLI